MAGRTTVVGVSKLRVGNPVGKGASVAVGVEEAVGEAVGKGVLVGVSEPLGVEVKVGGAGVQVIKVMLSAPS